MVFIHCWRRKSINTVDTEKETENTGDQLKSMEQKTSVRKGGKL